MYYCFYSIYSPPLNTNLEKIVIFAPIVTSVTNQNYIDIVLANSNTQSAPIATVSDVFTGKYYVTGIELVDSSTCTWRVYFNTKFTSSVNFRLSIHYKRLT